MRLSWAASITFLLAAACGQPAVDCGDEGHYAEDDLGRYCGYGVIIGGFTCPRELPFAFDIDLGIEPGLICTDRTGEEPLPLPRTICEDLDAGGECVATPRAERMCEQLEFPEGCATPMPDEDGFELLDRGGSAVVAVVDGTLGVWDSELYAVDGGRGAGFNVRIQPETHRSGNFQCWGYRARLHAGDRVIESPVQTIGGDDDMNPPLAVWTDDLVIPEEGLEAHLEVVQVLGPSIGEGTLVRSAPIALRDPCGLTR